MSRHSAFLLVSLANGLSLLRLLSVPLIVFLIWRTPVVDSSRYTACWLVVFLQVGDILDGYLARIGTQRLATPNRFGEIIDPIADKMYIGAGYITLAVTDQFPVWFGALVVVRDAAIILGWMTVFRLYRIRLRPNLLGKSTDAGLAVLLAAILLRITPALLGPMMFTITSMVLWSGYAYGRMALHSVSPAALEAMRRQPRTRSGQAGVQRGGGSSVS